MLKVSSSYTTGLGVFGWCNKQIYAESKRESWRSSEASTTIHKGHYRVWSLLQTGWNNGDYRLQ